MCEGDSQEIWNGSQAAVVRCMEPALNADNVNEQIRHFMAQHMHLVGVDPEERWLPDLIAMPGIIRRMQDPHFAHILGYDFDLALGKGMGRHGAEIVLALEHTYCGERALHSMQVRRRPPTEMEEAHQIIDSLIAFERWIRDRYGAGVHVVPAVALVPRIHDTRFKELQGIVSLVDFQRGWGRMYKQLKGESSAPPVRPTEGQVAQT